MGCNTSMPEVKNPQRPVGLNAPHQALGHTQSLETDYEVYWANPLGKGHYGKVYRGRHKKTGRPVAIKVRRIANRASRDCRTRRVARGRSWIASRAARIA